jgi:hypothetical protein
MPIKNSFVTKFFILGLCIGGVLGLLAFYYGGVLWGSAADSPNTGTRLEDSSSAYDISKIRNFEDAADQKNDILKNLVGTLSINIPELKLRDSRYWIYVDGQIQAAMPPPEIDLVRLSTRDEFVWLDEDGVVARLSKDYVVLYIKNDTVLDKLYKRVDYKLFPGEYLVELAVESRDVPAPPRAENSPFTFRKHKIKIEAGKTTNLNLKVPRISPTLITVMPALKTLKAPRERYRQVKLYQDYVKRVEKYFKKLREQYKRDRLVIALKNCYAAFKVSPPVYRSVYIDLSEEYGGSRDFDAVQVRLIVSFLKDKYSPRPGWWIPSLRIGFDEDIAEGFYQIFDYNSSFLKDLSLDELNEIAEMLEKVEK